MTAKRTTPDAERLLKARRAASKELRLPVTDWRVRRYALLACAHDNLTARLAAGAEINIDGLLKLDSAMQEIRASVPPVKTVEPELKSLPAPRAKPEGPPVERPHPGSIHDQPGVPLKRYDEPWRVYRRTC